MPRMNSPSFKSNMQFFADLSAKMIMTTIRRGQTKFARAARALMTSYKINISMIMLSTEQAGRPVSVSGLTHSFRNGSEFIDSSSESSVGRELYQPAP